MRFASLGSGSGGNALVVEAGSTRVLLDWGFSVSETAERLGMLGLAPDDLDAIIITHEHDDHAGGVARLARRYGLPVHLTYGTMSALNGDRALIPQINVIAVHEPFCIGDVEVFPFPVPHDAREPAQFVFGDGCRRLGVLTDTGSSTAHIVSVLSGVDALVLECNHDRLMLERGPYPPSLKNRVGGRFGHLENGAAAELLRSLDCSRLQHLIAAHLSRKNNTPELARSALAGALGCDPEGVEVATQESGFSWRDIR